MESLESIQPVQSVRDGAKPVCTFHPALSTGLTPAPALVTVGLEIQRLTEIGEELEIDFENELFINHTRGITREYSSLPDALREIVALGGKAGAFPP